MLLKTNAVSLQRGHKPLLRFPDLVVEKNDRILILGSSGSGKSTLLSIMAGLLSPASGQVLAQGKNIYDLSLSARDAWRARTIGFIFQSFHLLPSLTVSQNILLAASMAKVQIPQERLPDLLNALGLGEKLHEKPHALSHGQQQRAAIARAVLHQPAIIMADEPTSALDDQNAAQVMELLESQARQTGAALVIATHDSRIREKFQKIIHLDDIKKRGVA